VSDVHDRRGDALTGDRVRLEPLAEEHVSALAALGAEPEVARWWPDIDEAELLEKAHYDGREETFYAIVHDGEPVGLIQSSEELKPEYRHAQIDVFLGTRVHGQGLGRDAVRTLALHLARDRGHHRLTIDPAGANERAIRCYEAVGFRRVGVMRRYWRGPDGEWQDGLLMDLLAEELG
jgi:aminoglycoside 6'-N-acetyltransferase